MEFILFQFVKNWLRKSILKITVFRATIYLYSPKNLTYTVVAWVNLPPPALRRSAVRIQAPASNFFDFFNFQKFADTQEAYDVFRNGYKL